MYSRKLSLISLFESHQWKFSPHATFVHLLIDFFLVTSSSSKKEIIGFVQWEGMSGSLLYPNTSVKLKNTRLKPMVYLVRNCQPPPFPNSWILIFLVWMSLLLLQTPEWITLDDSYFPRYFSGSRCGEQGLSCSFPAGQTCEPDVGWVTITRHSNYLT